jgi:hypothetical protein
MRTYLATACLLLAAVGMTYAATGWTAELDLVALPESPNTIGILDGDETYLEIGFIGWGPNWQYLGFNGQVREQGDGSRLTSSATVRPSGAKIGLDVSVRQSGPQQLQLAIDLATDKATDLTSLIASLEIPRQPFAGGSMEITQADGQTRTLTLPLGRQNVGQQVQRIRLLDGAGRATAIAIQPPCDLAADGAARIVLADRRLEAGEPRRGGEEMGLAPSRRGENPGKSAVAKVPVPISSQPRRVTLTVDLPAAVTYYASADRVPDEPGFDRWYVFRPGRDFQTPSEIGLENWLDTPAGRHGRILRDGDALVYDDRPIKLWGLNVCYSSCAPERELAEQRARFYARYGINSVRLHKYADGTGWAGIQSPDSFVEFDAAALDRMDYFVAELKKRGIYVLLSPTFGVKLGPKDRQYVPYMDEFGSDKTRVSTGHGSIFLSRELQDLQIRQLVRLLEHRNPYTGLTYAQDPAVAVVELFNEDSSLFFGTLSQLQKVPTLRRRAGEQFTDWLKMRYGSQAALVEAWGERALEFLRQRGPDRRILGRPLDPAGRQPLVLRSRPIGRLAAGQTRAAVGYHAVPVRNPERLLRSLRRRDPADGLRRRDSGLELASGPRAQPLLQSAFRHLGRSGRPPQLLRRRQRRQDRQRQHVARAGFGTVEFRDAAGGRPAVHAVRVDSRLPERMGRRGTGDPGRVRDGPAGLGRLVHVPEPRSGRNAGAIGTRPLGGDRAAGAGHLSRRVAASAARRRSPIRGAGHALRPRSLAAPGTLGFEDRVTQQYDVKTFDSDKVPAQALAVARCVVEFTDEPQETPVFDLDPHRENGAYLSTTGQLRWQSGQSKLDGYFTIDSPATKAVVGFAEGQSCQLGEIGIQPSSHFAAVYVTAQQPDATIADARHLLVVAIARARNSGTRILRGTRLLERGGPPILMEPVAARISLQRPGQPKVHVLDHAGRRTGKTLPVENSVFDIDGARDQTCYYLIEY